MKVALALLAEYAAIEEDGDKIHILGGGLERMHGAVFPFVQPHLALVMKMSFDDGEWGLEHRFQIRITDGASNELQGPRSFSVSPQPPPEILAPQLASAPAVSVPVSLPVVHNIRDLVFPQPGRYLFSVILPDGVVGAQLPLQVSGNETDGSLGALLNAGYKAFVSGDLEGARAIFEQAVRMDPNSADAHNDFGFVNLARGQATAALRSFQRSQELGYDLMELADANIACCQYLLGNYSVAFDNFRRLMGVTLQNSPSVLFAVDRDGIKPIELQTAVHFVSLMALNAGYSALRAGSRVDALQFAQIATAGRLTFTDDEDKRRFILALDHLLEDQAASQT